MTDLLNRVGQFTATTGAGTVTLGAAIPSQQTFAAAGAIDGRTYSIRFEDGAAWELSWGAYSSTGPTLTRNLLASSTGSLLSLSGNAQVFCDALASDILSSYIGGCQLQLISTNLVLVPRGGVQIPLAGGVLRSIGSPNPTLAPNALYNSRATTNRVIAASVATLTFGAAHNLAVGAKILVENVGAANMTIRSGYDGGRVVATVPSSTTITYAAGIVTDASAADTGGVVYTVQYIYAYWTGTAVALESSLTAYTFDTVTGLAYKTGDTSRLLVGMAAQSGSAWVDTTTFRFVRSWYNRNKPVGQSKGTALRTFTSGTITTFAETHSEMRVRMLIWADESIMAFHSGAVINSTVTNVYSIFFVDGFNDVSAQHIAPPAAAGQFAGTGVLVGGPYPVNVGEGGHYVVSGIQAASGDVQYYWASNGFFPSLRCVII